MNELLVIVRQIVIMFLLMSVGFFIYKKKMIDDHSTKQLTDIVLYVVNPALSLVSFQQSFSVDKLVGFMIVFVLSFATIFLGILVGKIVIGKDFKLEQYACGFSNAGFIGIPLVQNLLGVEYVFYMSAFLVAFGLMSWTYGLYLISGKADISAKKLLSNPAILAAIFGMIIFVLQIELPGILTSTLSTIGNMNTPLGMIILGTYIAKEDIKKVFTSKQSYLVSLVRLLLVPLICLIVLRFIWVPLEELRMLLLICASAPCGATLAMFSQMCGKDYSYGAQIVSLSTLICPLTIMAVLSMATLLW